MRLAATCFNRRANLRRAFPKVLGVFLSKVHFRADFHPPI
jgi:hypothetical protein